MCPLTVPFPLQLQLEKHKGEILGVVVVESGWGSILPTVILANMMNGGPAARSGKLSIGDQIMSINGTSLVGLPLATCQGIIKVCILGSCAGGLLSPPAPDSRPRSILGTEKQGVPPLPNSETEAQRDPGMSPRQSADPTNSTYLKSEEDPSFPSLGKGKCHLTPWPAVPGIFPG